jgi:hypothetical protein
MPGPAMAVEEIQELTSNYKPLSRMAEKVRLRAAGCAMLIKLKPCGPE